MKNALIEARALNKENIFLAATDYLPKVAEVLGIPREQLIQLHEEVSFLEPKEQEIEYRLSEEKQLFDSTTVGKCGTKR
jgi:hypothetical protein